MQRLKLGGFKVAESRKGTQNVYKVETNILNRLFLSVRGTTIEPSNEKQFFWDFSLYSSRGTYCRSLVLPRIAASLAPKKTVAAAGGFVESCRGSILITYLSWTASKWFFIKVSRDSTKDTKCPQVHKKVTTMNLFWLKQTKKDRLRRTNNPNK